MTRDDHALDDCLYEVVRRRIELTDRELWLLSTHLHVELLMRGMGCEQDAGQAHDPA